MKPPMVIERFGWIVFVPFVLIGKLFKKIWDEMFDTDGAAWPLGWILVVILAIMPLFTTGFITFVEPATQDEIKSAYQEILQRPADAEGLKHYGDSVMSIEDVKEDLSKSEEKKKLDTNVKQDK